MEQTKAIQTFRKNSEGLPMIKTAESLAKMRMDVARYPHYSTVTRSCRIEWLNLEIMKFMRLSHMKPADTTLDAVALDEMIMDDRFMSDLIQPEMDYAFRQGVFGMYGEFFGITAMSLFGFLESYLTEEKKINAAKIIQEEKAKEHEKKRLAEREAEQRKIRAEIEEAKRNGSFTPTGKAWFHPKKVSDALDDSDAHREKIRRQAEQIFKEAKKEGRL